MPIKYQGLCENQIFSDDVLGLGAEYSILAVLRKKLGKTDINHIITLKMYNENMILLK